MASLQRSAGWAWPPAWDAVSKQPCCWLPFASRAVRPIRLALLRPRLLLRSRTCPKALYLFMLPIDFNGLDSAIHGPVRLGIMTALQMDGALDFSTLKKRLTVPDGSL